MRRIPLERLAFPSDPKRRLELAAFFTVLAIAAGARLVEATRVPTWFDEIFTIWVARLGPAGIVQFLRADVHPPLHEILVWMWSRLGGESDFWLRSLSVIFGVATVAATYGIARDLFGRAPALLAALLLALHRTHVYYSQEVRSYALLWLLDLLAIWSAWRFTRGGGRGAMIGYVAAATAALYTHYQSALLLATVAAWGLITLRSSPRRLTSWIAIHLAVAVLFLPQLPTLIHQMATHQGAHWAGRPQFADLVSLARAYAFGVSLVIVPALALALLPIVRRGERGAATLLWSATLPLIAISYVLSQHDAHLFTERYMEFALPAWCVLLAAGAIGLRWSAVAAAVSIGLAVIAALSLSRHEPLEEPRELHIAQQDLSRRAAPGDVVICADTHSLLFFMHHAPGLARYRLLELDPRLPYYEALGMVPDSAMITAPEFRSLRKSGARWWGVRTHHVGFDSRPGADTLGSYATSIRHLGPLVTVIDGQPQ